MPVEYSAGPNQHGIATRAGMHNDGHRYDTKRFDDVHKGMYFWRRKQLPTPGAQNYAFETMGLVEFTQIGAAVASRKHIRVTQPPQLYVPGVGLTLSGLGGVVAGGIAFAPLIDPYTVPVG